MSDTTRNPRPSGRGGSQKAIWYGARLVEATPFFASSKTCSACGTARATLRLDERTFRCDDDECGLVLDRDLNASRNLAKLAEHVAQSGCETKTLGERM